MEAYFVNPTTRKAGQGKTTKRRKTMAKRRQPAALRKYWAAKKAGKAVKKSIKRHYKKVGGKPKRRKATKARKASHRRGHQVKRHHRKGGSVHSYHRKGANVKRHWSNPFGLGEFGGVTIDGLIASGVFFGALFAVGYANGWTKKVPMLAEGWGEMAGKLAIALGVASVATMAVRRNLISRDTSKVIILAGFSPLALNLLGRVAPSIASGITLSEDEMDAALEMPQGHRLSDYTMDAELAAELNGPQHETESSSF